ncbi:MAG: tetratricopeptide repeat protein [Crinalium sp.]
MKPIIALFTILLLLPTKAIAVSTQKREPQPQQIAQVDLTAKLRSLAQAITVKITTSDNGGSGTLIAKQGQTYLVLTNAHVVTGDNYRIQTPDGKTYPAQVVPNVSFPNSDLSLLQFRSSQNYQIATLVSEKFLQVEEDEPVLAVGFDSATEELVTATGKIQLLAEKPLKQGYQIGYTNNIVQGMSGGAILNAAGEVIGVNGRAAFPILNSGYVYQDNSPLSPEVIKEVRAVSWGIPIQTFLAQLNPTVAQSFSFSLTQDDEEIVDNAPKFTGWLAKLNQQAQQISVRIDDLGTPNSSERGKLAGNGSGIIIAKLGNTYYVLTCAHVLPYENVRKFEILAPDGKRYRIDSSKIKKQEGVDLAVVQFTSSTNYQVATLADYNLKDYDYMFVGGYPNLRQLDPKWRFSLGQIFDKETGLLSTKTYTLETENAGSSPTKSPFASGYELVYSSITYGGMSGGAVLDSLGRVIGIHGSAEGETAIDDSLGDAANIQLGLSLGIPVGTFIGIADRFNLNRQWLRIENSPPPQLNDSQEDAVKAALLTVDVPHKKAKASQWIERGNQLWRLGRYDEAIAAFDEAIKLQPAFVYLAWYGRGSALRYQRKDEEAVVAFETAISKQPDYYPALYWQSVALRELKQLDKALVAIDKAIKTQPQDANLYNEKWAILSDLKRYPEATAAITEAIQISPRAVFYYNRGIVYAYQKQWQQAINDYNQAIKIDPQLAYAYNGRGTVYAYQKQWQQAINDYNQAIKIDPQLAYVYKNRGVVYHAQENFSAALSDYNKALSIDENFIAAINPIGLIKYEMGETDTAIQQWQKSLKVDAQQAEIQLALAVAMYTKGESDKALQLATQALKLDKQFAEVAHLPKNLWGKRLIADTHSLFADAKMQAVLAKL